MRIRRTLRLLIGYTRRTGFRSAIVRISGLDGRPSSKSRFREFAFLLRYLLMPITALLFLVPETTYRSNFERWLLLLAILAWNVTYNWVAIRETSWLQKWLTHLVDLAIVFTIFGLALSSDRLHPASNFGGALIRGSFHPQTFGPLITVGAFLPARKALRLSLVAGGFYVLALLVAGVPPSSLTNSQQLTTIVLVLLSYVAVAALASAYTAALQRLREVLDEGAARGKRLGSIIERRQVEAEMHDKILTPRAISAAIPRGVM